MAHIGAYPTTGGWIKPAGRGNNKSLSIDRYPSKTIRGEMVCTTKKGDQRKEEKPKIFVICLVRNVKPKIQKCIEAYVTQLEQEGYDVYWPARDTDQSDPIGLTICETNRTAIERAGAIHIWFDPQSQGSLFDFGMTFAFLKYSKKRIVIANRHEVQRTPHKSFQNVLLELSLRTRE